MTKPETARYTRALAASNEHLLVQTYQATFRAALSSPTEEQRRGARIEHTLVHAELLRRGYLVPKLDEATGSFVEPATVALALLRCLERGEAKPREGQTLEEAVAELRGEIERFNAPSVPVVQDSAESKPTMARVGLAPVGYLVGRSSRT